MSSYFSFGAKEDERKVRNCLAAGESGSFSFQYSRISESWSIPFNGIRRILSKAL